MPPKEEELEDVDTLGNTPSPAAAAAAAAAAAVDACTPPTPATHRGKSVAPALRAGDAMLFDFRLLHKALANGGVVAHYYVSINHN